MTEHEMKSIYARVGEMWRAIKGGDQGALMAFEFGELIWKITGGNPKTDAFWFEIVPQAEAIARKYEGAEDCKRWVQGILFVADTVAVDRDQKGGK